MTHSDLWNSHPRKFGKGSRECKACGKRAGLIRKYNMMLCRNCFREKHREIGFHKYS